MTNNVLSKTKVTNEWTHTGSHIMWHIELLMCFQTIHNSYALWKAKDVFVKLVVLWYCVDMTQTGIIMMSEKEADLKENRPSATRSVLWNFPQLQWTCFIIQSNVLNLFSVDIVKTITFFIGVNYVIARVCMLTKSKLFNTTWESNYLA